MSSIMASSSSLSSSPLVVRIGTHGVKHDVFLSFRGETRKRFTSHLHRALTSKGIDAYIDERLDGGESIDTLFTNISKSLVSIVIFSPNYAGSRWCLDELATIVECKNTKQQRVLPVFCGVEPTHVRKQTGAFGDAFQSLLLKNVEYMHKEQSWRNSLLEIANLSGWDAEEKSEDIIIEEIVGNIQNFLRIVSMDDLENGFFGKSRIHKVESLLNMISVSSENVSCIGILGEHGIGKTAIANIVFGRNYEAFGNACLMTNVEKQLMKTGMNSLKLHRDMVVKLLGGSCRYQTSTRVQLPPIVQAKLRRQKTLIVLDDVRSDGTLRIILGSPNLYGPGSRIIITSTRKRVLQQHCEKVYKVKKLDKHEAMELFQFHAFFGDEESPSVVLVELAEKIVDHCNGLPLLVKCTGKNLMGKKGIKEWEQELAMLKETPSLALARAMGSATANMEDMLKDILDPVERAALGVIMVYQDTVGLMEKTFSDLIMDPAQEAMSSLGEEEEEIMDSDSDEELKELIDSVKSKITVLDEKVEDLIDSVEKVMSDLAEETKEIVDILDSDSESDSNSESLKEIVSDLAEEVEEIIDSAKEVILDLGTETTEIIDSLDSLPELITDLAVEVKEMIDLTKEVVSDLSEETKEIAYSLEDKIDSATNKMLCFAHDALSFFSD